MSVYPRTAEKKRIMQEYRMRHEEMTSVALNRPRPLSPKAQLEQEKRIRREIANSNERRRMQSINAGFQSLKTLLPHHAGEKLSKAAILQQTSEYISSLERDKTTVMAENDRLRQQLMNINNTLNSINAAVAEESPPPKRKKRDTESSDEGIGLCEESTQLDEMRKKLLDIQLHFDQEKRMRLKFEDRSRALEAKLQKLSSHVLDKEAAVMSLNEVDEKPSQPLFNSSMSRRNLETIVEAIRHLEGDRIGLGLEEQQHPSNMSPLSAFESINAPPAHQHGNAVCNSNGGRGVVNITEQQQRQKKQCSGTSETVAPCSATVQGKESCVKMAGSVGGGVVGGDEDKENCRSKDDTPLLSPINDDEDASDDIEEDDDGGDDISDDDDDNDDVIDDNAVNDDGDDCNDDCVDDDDDDEDDDNSELLSPVDFSTTGQHHNNNNNNGHKNTPVFTSTVITTTTSTTTPTNVSLINNNNNNNTSSFSIPPSSLSVLSTTPSSTSSSTSSSSSSSLLTAAASKTPKPTLQQQHHHNQSQQQQQQLLHPALSTVAAATVADTPAPPSAHSPVLVATTAAQPIIPAAHHHHQQQQQQQQTQQHRQQLQQQQHHHHHHHHHHQQHQQQQHHQHHQQQHQVVASDCTSVVKTNLSSSCFSTTTPTKYPTASTLLHRAPPYTINQIYQRPGVIVHKS